MQKKQIMSDPVGHYSNLWPDNIDTLNNIKTLWQYYQSLDQQLKDVQKKAGNISRQIGIAKRDKQSTDMLITAMRTVSDERRSLINRIKHNNLEILSHFQSGENMPRQLDPGHNDHSEVHRYSC